MKSFITLKGLLIVVALFTMACESRKADDGVEIAKKNNDENFENRDKEKDADFVVNSIASNYAEIELAKLATNHSTDDGIKMISQQLEKDHQAVLSDLQSYANRKGIVVPTAESEDQRKERMKLAEKVNEDDFNEELCKVLVDYHEESIKNFEDQEDKTEDPELRSWIASTLPTLKVHLNSLKAHEDK